MTPPIPIPLIVAVVYFEGNRAAKPKIVPWSMEDERPIKKAATKAKIAFGLSSKLDEHTAGIKISATEYTKSVDMILLLKENMGPNLVKTSKVIQDGQLTTADK
mmetsp:Transcript_21774/g.27746  ORF Transcript_21774/g.27746 Transcript_21774/m.27746 type:complete len:104 (-) Transcript_21774:226-537(-)